MITNTELLEYFDSTADVYQFLSQVFFKELNEQAIAELQDTEWPKDTGNEHLDTGFAQIRRYFNLAAADKRTQLAVDYARIFLAAGVYTKETRNAIPYESVFTSDEHLMMGPARADCVARYSEDGFAVNPDLHEPEDHLAFQLEYLSVMNVRAADLARNKDSEGLKQNMARQLDFIALHQLNWLPELLAAAVDAAKTTFYTGMLHVALGTAEQARDMLLEATAQMSQGAQGE